MQYGISYRKPEEMLEERGVELNRYDCFRWMPVTSITAEMINDI